MSTVSELHARLELLRPMHAAEAVSALYTRVPPLTQDEHAAMRDLAMAILRIELPAGQEQAQATVRAELEPAPAVRTPQRHPSLMRGPKTATPAPAKPAAPPPRAATPDEIRRQARLGRSTPTTPPAPPAEGATS